MEGRKSNEAGTHLYYVTQSDPKGKAAYDHEGHVINHVGCIWVGRIRDNFTSLWNKRQ